MSVCLVCGLAEHGECRCDDNYADYNFTKGYRKAIEDAAKGFEKKEDMLFRGFEVAALLRALLGGGKE